MTLLLSFRLWDAVCSHSLSKQTLDRARGRYLYRVKVLLLARVAAIQAVGVWIKQI